MKIDRQIVTMVEHVLIRDTDDGTVYVNQRVSNKKQPKTSEINTDEIKSETKND